MSYFYFNRLTTFSLANNKRVADYLIWQLIPDLVDCELLDGFSTSYINRPVLCDTSILTVDTDVTIPVSPRSRCTAVYRRTNNYRETTQLNASIVSIADAVQLFPL